SCLYWHASVLSSGRKLPEFSVAVPDLIRVDVELFQQTDVQIRERCIFGVLNVTSAFEFAAPAPYQHDGQVSGIVRIAIAHTRAKNQLRLIKEETVSIGSGPHLFYEIRKLRGMEQIDFGQLREPLGISLMVRNRMMRIGHSGFRVGPAAEFMGEHEGD